MIKNLKRHTHGIVEIHPYLTYIQLITFKRRMFSKSHIPPEKYRHYTLTRCKVQPRVSVKERLRLLYRKANASLYKNPGAGGHQFYCQNLSTALRPRKNRRLIRTRSYHSRYRTTRVFGMRPSTRSNTHIAGRG